MSTTSKGQTTTPGPEHCQRKNLSPLSKFSYRWFCSSFLDKNDPETHFLILPSISFNYFRTLDSLHRVTQTTINLSTVNEYNHFKTRDYQLVRDNSHCANHNSYISYLIHRCLYNSNNFQLTKYISHNYQHRAHTPHNSTDCRFKKRTTMLYYKQVIISTTQLTTNIHVEFCNIQLVTIFFCTIHSTYHTVRTLDTT